jgi:hypothetical protein
MKIGWCKRAAPGLVVAHGVEGDAFVSCPAPQPVERVADIDAVPVLFDRDDLHVDVLQAGGYVTLAW